MQQIDADFKFSLEVNNRCLQSIIPGALNPKSSLDHLTLLVRILSGAKPVALFNKAALMSASAVRLAESGHLRPVLQIDFCHNKVLSAINYFLSTSVY
jgi:hypothetical protein